MPPTSSQDYSLKLEELSPKTYTATTDYDFDYETHFLIKYACFARVHTNLSILTHIKEYKTCS